MEIIQKLIFENAYAHINGHGSPIVKSFQHLNISQSSIYKKKEFYQ